MTRVGLLVPMLAVPIACASKPRAPVGHVEASPKVKAAPAWLMKFPTACALGESGPTLVPTDALAEARRKARAVLATRASDHKTRFASSVSTSEHETQARELVLEQGEGTVEGSEIVTMWYDATGSGPASAPGSAYAIACPLRDIPSEVSGWMARWREERGGPQWVYSLPGAVHQLCVVGVCGPTLRKSDAAENVEDIARAELAQAIFLHAESTTAVLEGDETLYAAVTRTCDDCQERAKAGKIVDRWFDEKGEGPLPYAGTIYALMCLSS